MIITIDGPSGTGKSTVARGVAKRLGFTFFDTGAMYRSVAWKILEAGIDPADQTKVSAFMPQFVFRIETDNKGERRYFVGENEVTHSIRSPQISSLASQIAVYPEVRKALVEIQRKFGSETNAVFEGRDMGTVVFPNADLKIFLTANPEVRAERRYKELISKFPDLSGNLSFQQILDEIRQRDQNDSTRAISPLKQASDAILIDTSYLSVDQVIEKILSLQAHLKKPYPKMKWFYRAVYTLARTYFKTFFRLKIYGLEHFRPGAGILIANHVSLFDPQVLSISCPEEVQFLAKASLFKIPLLNWLIRALNTHPVSRGASDLQTFKKLLQLLEEGKKVILFPEGRRSFDGKLQAHERGIAFLVQKAKCRVIPAYLKGTFEAWPRNKKFPKLFGRMACVFGSPIEWSEFERLEKKEVQDRIIERTEQAIRDLKAWYEEGAIGSPP